MPGPCQSYFACGTPASHQCILTTNCSDADHCQPDHHSYTVAIPLKLPSGIDLITRSPHAAGRSSSRLFGLVSWNCQLSHSSCTTQPTPCQALPTESESACIPCQTAVVLLWGVTVTQLRNQTAKKHIQSCRRSHVLTVACVDSTQEMLCRSAVCDCSPVCSHFFCDQQDY